MRLPERMKGVTTGNTLGGTQSMARSEKGTYIVGTLDGNQSDEGYE